MKHIKLSQEHMSLLKSTLNFFSLHKNNPTNTSFMNRCLMFCDQIINEIDKTGADGEIVIADEAVIYCLYAVNTVAEFKQVARGLIDYDIDELVDEIKKEFDPDGLFFQKENANNGE